MEIQIKIGLQYNSSTVDCVWNVMAHAQKPDFVFRRNGRVHLNRRGRQFSRLLAAEVCASAVVMLEYTKFRGSVKSTGYQIHSPVSSSLPLPCVTACLHISTGLYSAYWRKYSTLAPTSLLKYSNGRLDIRYDGKVHSMAHLLVCNASHIALWSIVFDKLTVAQSGKKFCAFHAIRIFVRVFADVHHRFQRAPHRNHGTLPTSKFL